MTPTKVHDLINATPLDHGPPPDIEKNAPSQKDTLEYKTDCLEQILGDLILPIVPSGPTKSSETIGDTIDLNIDDED